MFIQYFGHGGAVVRFFAKHKSFCFQSHIISSSILAICTSFVFVFNRTTFALSQFFLIIFSKSGSKWVGGIENTYHDPCQDWLDLIDMKLTSPNYPESYDPNTVCKWHLTTDEGYISLDLEYIYVSDNDNDNEMLP